MAKPGSDLKTRIENLRPAPERELGLYTDEDMSPSTVEQRDALVAKALEDKTLATKLFKTFEVVVEKVPASDRITIVKGVVLVVLASIAAFTWLKSTGKW